MIGYFVLASVVVACAHARVILFSPCALPASPSVSYRGQYAGVFAYVENEAPVSVSERSGAISVSSHDDSIILHVQPAVLDSAIFPSYRPEQTIAEAKRRLRREPAPPEHDSQLVFDAESAQPRLLYEVDGSAFLEIPPPVLHESLEELVALPHLQITLVPPFEQVVPDSSKLGEDRARIARLLESLTFNDTIDRLSHDIEAKQLRSIVRRLSAEDGRAEWKTRHSFTTGARMVAHWLKEQYEEAGLECRLMHYFAGFSPNVICSFDPLEPGVNATGLPTVVIGAHYDDRGSFGYVRAPGADDDGSGSAMLLSLARAIKRHRIRFNGTQVIFAAFSGEEQGLWGSRYFAKELRDDGRDVILMLQADMLAYRKPGEALQLAFPAVHSVPEARWLVGNVSKLYTPELRTGITPACCSDQQSFDDMGYVSSWVFERAGPIADPKYHNSGDLSEREGYDFEQLRLISSTLLATLLSVVTFVQSR